MALKFLDAAVMNSVPAGTEAGLVVRVASQPAGGAATDVTDRVGRLLGIVASITAAVDISDRAGRLLGIIASITAPVDVSDRAARLLGVIASITAAVDVSDRVGRLLGHVNVDNFPASQAVTGTFWQATQPVSLAAAVDVSDRVGRLLGVVASITAAVDVSDRAARLLGVLSTGANVIGALTANQSVNTAQVAGTATGTAAAGVQKVGVVGNAGAVFDAATAAAVPANALFEGLRAAVANPTAVTVGQLVGAMSDILGKQIVKLAAPRERVVQNTITLTAVTETTLIAAGAAGIFRDLTHLTLTNTSATATRVDIRDATAGTVRRSIWLPGGATVVIPMDIPMNQTTAAANWTAQLSVAVTDVRIFAQSIETV